MPDLASISNQSSHNNTTQALLQQLEESLNSRVEPLNFKLLMSLPERHRSFRIVNGEMGFRVCLLGEGDHLHEELASALATLENVHQQLPGISLSEKLALRTREVVMSLINSATPLALVRSGLSLLTPVQVVLRLQVEDARNYHQVKVDTLSYFLQETVRNTAKLIHRNQFYFVWNYACRLRHLRQTSSASALVPDFYWAERADYSAMTNACKDSRVLATIHMGDFFGAFKCIADQLQESRPVISLRREGETEGIKNLNQRLADDHQIFMHGKDNPVRIVNALRAGGKTLSILFDLGGDFGETTEVIFFGHRARFVRGPAEMAILGRARIFPFVCFEDAGRGCISMEPSFLPELRSGESLHDAVTRVTQALVSLAERWIRQNPAQWKYLDRLPHYMILDEPATDVDAGDSEQQQGAGFNA